MIWVLWHIPDGSSKEPFMFDFPFRPRSKTRGVPQFEEKVCLEMIFGLFTKEKGHQKAWYHLFVISKHFLPKFKPLVHSFHVKRSWWFDDSWLGRARVGGRKDLVEMSNLIMLYYTILPVSPQLYCIKGLLTKQLPGDLNEYK